MTSSSSIYCDSTAIDVDHQYTVEDEQGNTNNIMRVTSIHLDKTPVEAPNPRVAQLNTTPLSRDGVQTPDMANTASEVADSAALLDRDTPEPEIADEQAGRIGFRRLSGTPIGEVSRTAAEVATTAANLDIDRSAPRSGSETGHIEPPHHICPMFSHECIDVPDEDEAYDEDLVAPEALPDDYQQHDLSKIKQHEYAQDSDIDLDNPMLERFPSDSTSIMAAIRRLSTSVGEDRALPQGVAPSLVVNSLTPTTSDLPDDQDSTVPQIDQVTTGDQPSRVEKKKSALSASVGSISSLNSIAEAEDERPNDELSKYHDERPSTTVQHPDFSVEPSVLIGTQTGDEESYTEIPGGGVTRLGPAATLSSKGNPLASDDDEGIAMCTVARERPAEGNLDGADLMISDPVGYLRMPPSHIVEPLLQSSTPLPEEDRFDSAEIVNPSGLAVNHARSMSPHIVISSVGDVGKADSIGHSNQSSFKKGYVDRPASSLSMSSPHQVGNNTNWLKAFFHILLVDWIGGFISRLWSGGRTG